MDSTSTSTGGERVGKRVTVLGFAAGSNQLWKGPNSYNIQKALTSYHCHIGIKDTVINKLGGMTSISKMNVKIKFEEHPLTSLNSAFNTQCPRVDCH